MTQFGTPQRSATSDANAGKVNPPAIRREERRGAIKQKSLTSLDEGVMGVGEALGNALVSRLSNEATNINERRATEASIRQGQDHAVNQIDSVKKRTGWEKGVFGQNIEYRAAQQRAAQNAVNSTYLEQATQLEKYAGETPDEYSGRLLTGLDKIVEPYKGDKETKQLVTAAWQSASAKLAAKHYEAHYAYNQLQQRDTYSKQVAQTFDTWTVDASLISTPQEATGLIQVAEGFFKGATKPEGMDSTAWRSVVNENLHNSLRQGNIGAYNAANQSGWLESLTAQERVELDRAISAYDTDFSQKVARIYESGELSALEVTTAEEAVALYETTRDRLTELGKRSSGTDRAELALTRGHVTTEKGKKRVEDNRSRVEKEARKIAEKAAIAAAKKEADKARLDSIVDATRLTDPIDRAAKLANLDPKKTEIEDALDASIVEDVQTLIGNKEPITIEDASKKLLSDVTIAKSIAKRLKGQEVNSPVVKRAIETFINGFHGLTDENGRLNEQGVTAMAAIAQFEQNEDTFKTLVGTSNYDRYEIIRRGMSIGQTLDMVGKDLDAFSANQGDRSKYGVQWELGENESKRDRIQALVGAFTKQIPTSAALAHYMEEYDRALVIYKGDRRAAEQYLRKSTMNAAINYQGRVITNGKRLNDVTSYNFQQLMDGAQRTTGNSASLIQPYISAMTGMIGVNEINKVEGLTIETVDGVDGFFIDSINAQAPVHITTDVMKRWADTLDQRRNMQKLRQSNQRKAIESFNNAIGKSIDKLRSF